MPSVTLSPGPLERREHVEIKMELDKAAYARHASAVRALVPDFKLQMRGGDTLSVRYKFVIEYFGDVAEKLEAVQTLCSDPDVVQTASCADLEQGRILVYEVLKRLDAVIKQVKGK